MPTKEELQAMLDVEKEKRLEAESQLADVEGQIKSLSVASGKEGWLIETKEQNYDGDVHGVSFVNGQAFVVKGQVIEGFDFKPMKESSMDRLGYSAEEKAKIRKREEMSSAERVVEVLKSDFGYSVVEITNENYGDLSARIGERTKQRVELEKLLSAERNADAITRPGFAGEK